MNGIEMPNIEFKNNIEKRIVNVRNSEDSICFYKDIEYFDESRPYERFIKATESLIRKSKDYKVFEGWVFNVLGIQYSQVHPNITAEMATIEMHHGPLFTLYDYVSVVLNHYLRTGRKITTFRVADTVLQEHFDLCVQVVMLDATSHEAVHNRDLFLNIKAGIGNINLFIKKYIDAFNPDQKYRIYNYINFCKSNPSFDTGVLDIDDIAPLIQDSL
jgi:hypothetical protein